MPDKKPKTADDRNFKPEAQKRILIVDDDAALAKLLEGFFTKAGFETRFATKGKEAIEIYKELRPHLVLLDVLLPDIMGLDVLKRMRDPSWSENTHFIVMSGIMKDKKAVMDIKTVHKAHEFIEKPFQVKELNRTIAIHLGLPAPEEEKPPAPDRDKSASPNPKAPAIPEPAVTIEGGDLATVDMARLLCAFLMAKVTGVLKISFNSLVKAIYFEGGKPIFAASQDPKDRLGEIIVRNGILSTQQVEAAIQKAGGAARLGVTLIEMGLLSQTNLINLIQLQVREIILSGFGWAGGRYAFNFEDLASKEMIKLQTSPADLVLEGVRRHYTLPRLLSSLTTKERTFARSPSQPFQVGELHLGTTETAIWELIDGKRSMDRLVQDSQKPELEVFQLVYSLLVLKMIVDKA